MSDAAAWDARYGTGSWLFGQEPNRYLESLSPRLRPGMTALCLGDGEGRNGVWLAAQGHEVLSVDASAVGLDKARTLARQQGVALQTLQADLDTWTPEPASCDAVVLTYVHLPAQARPAIHRRLARALRPGGWLLLEAFHPGQLAFTSGGPKDVDMLYTLAALRQDFAGLLREELGAEVLANLDEGPGHQGPAQVVRWLGQAL